MKLVIVLPRKTIYIYRELEFSDYFNVYEQGASHNCSSQSSYEMPNDNGSCFAKSKVSFVSDNAAIVLTS